MNKIVCDVCGTSYPETAQQCPICATAKTDANKSTAGGEAGYAYVKGGRFSHANVRKRNAGNKELPRVVVPAKPAKQKPAPKKETATAAAQTAAKKQPAPAKQTKSAAQKKEKAFINRHLKLLMYRQVSMFLLIRMY